jgi:hypothetical protein
VFGHGIFLTKIDTFYLGTVNGPTRSERGAAKETASPEYLIDRDPFGACFVVTTQSEGIHDP